MKTTTILTLLLFFTLSLSAQKSKAENYLEGGKILVDIVKVFKDKKGGEEKEDDCDDQISQLCFQNKTQSTVKIKVEMKMETPEEAEPTELIIPVKGKECSYLTVEGIYTYEISFPEEDGTDSLIRKGEFNIKDCIEIFIKVEDP